MFDLLLSAFSPMNIFLALMGVAAGTVIGSIPGLTATMAVAVLTPITFSLAPESALILLGAIYTGAIYGGAYAAILLNTPGTPSAIGTTFDGYPMAKRGDGDLAVTIACLASVFGGLVGALALLLLAPPLATAALAFGPVEYFWMAIFGLSLISALSTGDFFKGMIGAGFGLLISTIGISETSAEVRFTFGSSTLIGGVEIVSALIGLYCIPVLIDLVATAGRHLDTPEAGRGIRFPEALSAMMRNKVNVIRSSVIGTLVGALPGAGGSIAGLVAYSEARRVGKGKEKYGEGNPGGIIATESANNATVGGGFIPTLVLGIPGTPPDAVILGALLVQGVRTGPTLFESGSGMIYTFIFGLFLATILMLPVGLLIGRFAYGTIVKAPKAALVPVVAFMTVIGAFAIRNSLSDVAIMVVLGVVGWLANRRGFSVSPIVLGLILGSIAEQGFVQSWTIGSATDNLFGQFFGRPLSMVIIVLTALSFIYPFLPQIKKMFSSKEEKTHLPSQGSTASFAIRVADLVALAFFGAIALIVIVQSADLNPEAGAFPRTVAIGMCVMVIISMFNVLRNQQEVVVIREGSLMRRIIVPLAMLGAVALIPLFGFALAGLIMAGVLLVTAQHEVTSSRAWFGLAAGVGAVIILFTFGFKALLDVPLPMGTLF